MSAEGSSLEGGSIESSFKSAAMETTSPSADYGAITEYGSAADAQTTQSTVTDTPTESAWSDGDASLSVSDAWDDAPSEGIDADLETSMQADVGSDPSPDVGVDHAQLEDPLDEINSMELQDLPSRNLAQDLNDRVDLSASPEDSEEDPLSELESIDAMNNATSAESAFHDAAQEVTTPANSALTNIESVSREVGEPAVQHEIPPHDFVAMPPGSPFAQTMSGPWNETQIPVTNITYTDNVSRQTEIDEITKSQEEEKNEDTEAGYEVLEYEQDREKEMAGHKDGHLIAGQVDLKGDSLNAMHHHGVEPDAVSAGFLTAALVTRLGVEKAKSLLGGKADAET